MTAWISGLMLAVAAQAGAAPPMAGMDHPPADCPAGTAALPAELAGWSRMTALDAGGSVAKAATLTIGAGAKATLLPTPNVAYPLPPAKPGSAASSGGLFAFTVPNAGRYRVALGAGPWIDVVRDGAAVTSVAHGHGPACSRVRKMVDFDLAPGRYLLQVAGSASPTLPLLIARLP